MWTFEHSVACAANREFAWRFWTNVENWPIVDPAVETVTLNGAFATGAIGTTKPVNMDPVNWKLVEVQDGESAVVEIIVSGASAKFHWTFAEAEGNNTRLTQRATIEGENANDYLEFGKVLEMEMPPGMQRLADVIAQVAKQEKA